MHSTINFWEMGGYDSEQPIAADEGDDSSVISGDENMESIKGVTVCKRLSSPLTSHIELNE